jgi:hypothetical protein
MVVLMALLIVVAVFAEVVVGFEVLMEQLVQLCRDNHHIFHRQNVSCIQKKVHTFQFENCGRFL